MDTVNIKPRFNSGPGTSSLNEENNDKDVQYVLKENKRRSDLEDNEEVSINIKTWILVALFIVILIGFFALVLWLTSKTDKENKSQHTPQEIPHNYAIHAHHNQGKQSMKSRPQEFHKREPEKNVHFKEPADPKELENVINSSSMWVDEKESITDDELVEAIITEENEEEDVDYET
jgi:flagellar biosynthesis/type III secretory pathway M-ring protein FliF/YscJ